MAPGDAATPATESQPAAPEQPEPPAPPKRMLEIEAHLQPYVGVQALATRSTGNFDYVGFGGGAHTGIRVEVSEPLSLEPRATADYLRSRAELGLTTPIESERRAVALGGHVRVAEWF